MKYNKSYEDGDFGDYLEYLKTIKDKIPQELYNFISDSQRHDLGEKSLHDSRIKKIEYDFDKNYQMSLLLTGENREFDLQFTNISQLHINQMNNGDIYKDLITFEIGIEKDIFGKERIVFRAIFPCQEGIIEVFSEQLEINENVLQQGV